MLWCSSSSACGRPGIPVVGWAVKLSPHQKEACETGHAGFCCHQIGVGYCKPHGCKIVKKCDSFGSHSSVSSLCIWLGNFLGSMAVFSSRVESEICITSSHIGLLLSQSCGRLTGVVQISSGSRYK